MDRNQHLADWRLVWNKVAPLTAAERDRFARESLQLVRAALIYQRNALEMFEEPELHDLLRLPAASVTTAGDWPPGDDVLFPALMASPDLRLGGIFLASASVRLPVAVLKAVELSASPFEEGEIRLLERESEWRRSTISGLFDKIKLLGCCEDGSLTLHEALAIAVVHRDDFGHGELGQPATEGGYKQRREAVLDTVRVCRLLQAQRKVCGWTLDRLAGSR
jgi:hypothetical protein